MQEFQVDLRFLRGKKKEQKKVTQLTIPRKMRFDQMSSTWEKQTVHWWSEVPPNAKFLANYLFVH